MIANDEHRKQFNVYQNTIENLYEACKPDIVKAENDDKQWVKVFGYLRGCVDANVDCGNLESAKQRIANLLDESILTDDDVKQKWLSYRINREKEIEVGALDFDALKTKYKNSSFKNLEVAHLREFVEKKLRDLLEVNHTRKNFVERLQNIINEYNSGGRTTEQIFEDLNRFKDDLSKEDERHVVEGLSKEELELFDLLYKEKLTANERIAVKNTTKDLLQKLKQLIVKQPFWYKNTQDMIIVKHSIQNVLNDELPQSYDKTIFVKKCDDVFNLIYERALNTESAYYH